MLYLLDNRIIDLDERVNELYSFLMDKFDVLSVLDVHKSYQKKDFYVVNASVNSIYKKSLTKTQIPISMNTTQCILEWIKE